MNRKLTYTILTLVLANIVNTTLNAQVNYCPNDDCTKCRLLREVDYQFNAIRNDIALPQTLDGKTIHWQIENREGGDTPYMAFDGQTIHIKSLPKGEYQPAGTLYAEVGGEKVKFNLTLAPDDEMYGYLYCHMAGNGENTNYAIGTKADRGEIFHPIINNQPIFNPEDVARIEGGVRDAFIIRGKDNNYLMVNTDMCNRKSRVWLNYGIDLLKSNDLIHWTSVSFDFRKGNEVFSDPQSKDYIKDYTKINRVWAPQIIWDENYNDGEGGYLIYYSILSTNEGDTYDKIYYSYANRDFTTLTKPQLMHDHGISVIDCHIDWNDCDQRYHVFYKKEGAAGVDRGIHEAVFDKLPVSEWRNVLHITNEGKEQVEGGSAFRLINENTWKIAYIKYSGQRVYRVCNANATEENVDRGVVIGTNVNPQHGSFMQITKDEYDLLQTWSDLKLKVQELEANPKAAKNKKLKAAKEALNKTFATNPIPQLLKLYKDTLKTL